VLEAGRLQKIKIKRWLRSWVFTPLGNVKIKLINKVERKRRSIPDYAMGNRSSELGLIRRERCWRPGDCRRSHFLQVSSRSSELRLPIASSMAEKKKGRKRSKIKRWLRSWVFTRRERCWRPGDCRRSHFLQVSSRSAFIYFWNSILVL
jgi:hypothetical protein